MIINNSFLKNLCVFTIGVCMCTQALWAVDTGDNSDAPMPLMRTDDLADFEDFFTNLLNALTGPDLDQVQVLFTAPEEEQEEEDDDDAPVVLRNLPLPGQGMFIAVQLEHERLRLEAEGRQLLLAHLPSAQGFF